MKKKYASAMVLAALLGAQCYAGGVEAWDAPEKVGNDTGSADSIVIGAGNDAGIFNSANKEISFSGEDISITMNRREGWTGEIYGVCAAVNDEGNAVINLGADNTKLINITLQDDSEIDKELVGLRTVGGNTQYGGIIQVKGEQLNITGQTKNGWIYGVWAQNNSTPTTDDPSKDNARVDIKAENTYIDVGVADDGTGSSTGLVAMSQGEINIDSNLEIHADDIIVTRGNSKININTDGTHTTKLYGDVNFNYDFVTSQTVIDSTVNINLTGADSIWEGNTRFSWTATTGNAPTNEDLAVNSLHLTISDGAQWTPNAVPKGKEEYHFGAGAPDFGVDDYVETNQVTLNDGIINIKGSETQDGKYTGITIGNLNGTGGTINLEADDQFNTRDLNIKTAGSNDEGGTESAPTQLVVNFTGINADDISTDKAKQQEQLETLADNIKFGTDGAGIDGQNLNATATVGEGLINGGISAVMNTADGGTGNIKQNNTTTTMDNMRDIAAVSIAAWRQEDSTLSQRLGDLRESKEGQGIWARMNRGEFEYSGAFKNQYNYFQIGYDMAKGDWHYGAAVSHTDGETSYANGYGENDSTSLSLYGTRLMNDGQYLDLVLKVGRLSNEFDNYAEAGHTHGDYDAWGTAISGEYGKKLDLKEGWFVTPQAQLSLMRIGGEDYTTSNKIAVSQDTLYSAVGRVGFEAGKDTGWGSFYAKASVLHEFAGDADTYVRLGDLSNSYSQDLGDTWYEAGFGFNWKMGNGSYFYADVIRTFGGDIDTPWQWNAGVRWGF